MIHRVCVEVLDSNRSKAKKQETLNVHFVGLSASE